MDIGFGDVAAKGINAHDQRIEFKVPDIHRVGLDVELITWQGDCRHIGIALDGNAFLVDQHRRAWIWRRPRFDRHDPVGSGSGDGRGQRMEMGSVDRLTDRHDQYVGRHHPSFQTFERQTRSKPVRRVLAFVMIGAERIGADS